MFRKSHFNNAGRQGKPFFFGTFELNPVLDRLFVPSLYRAFRVLSKAEETCLYIFKIHFPDTAMENCRVVENYEILLRETKNCGC